MQQNYEYNRISKCVRFLFSKDGETFSEQADRLLVQHITLYIVAYHNNNSILLK